MAISCRPRAAWRRALLISAAVHASFLAIFYLWPRNVDSVFAEPSSVITARSPGLRLESRRTGEEASDEVGSFQSAIKSHLLIDPKLDTSIPVKSTVPQVMEPGKVAAKDIDSFPGKGAVGRHGKTGTGARFFQVETQAKRVVYVLDASSSMGKDGLWTRACTELLRSLEHLPRDTVFQTIVYHSHARPLIPARPGWLSYDDATRTHIKQALSNLSPEGKTVHGPALNLALAMRPDVVFFLTDADDLSFELLRQVETWNRGGAIIHTFELNGFGDRPGTPMQMLAQRHGGEYRAVGKGSIEN